MNMQDLEQIIAKPWANLLNKTEDCFAIISSAVSTSIAKVATVRSSGLRHIDRYNHRFVQDDPCPLCWHISIEMIASTFFVQKIFKQL